MSEWTDLKLLEAYCETLSKDSAVEIEIAVAINNAVDEIRYLRSRQRWWVFWSWK